MERGSQILPLLLMRLKKHFYLTITFFQTMLQFYSYPKELFITAKNNTNTTI